MCTGRCFCSLCGKHAELAIKKAAQVALAWVGLLLHQLAATGSGQGVCSDCASGTASLANSTFVRSTAHPACTLRHSHCQVHLALFRSRAHHALGGAGSTGACVDTLMAEVQNRSPTVESNCRLHGPAHGHTAEFCGYGNKPAQQSKPAVA